MKRIVRIICIVGITALFFAAIVFSNVKPVDVPSEIWNEAMTLGDAETAVRHYVVYTDLMCPYCNYYARVIQENEEEFKQFLEENKIAYEVRVTDSLYEGSGVEYSRPAAEGAYCAARENRFWDYYHTAISHIFEDYYKKGIGYSKTAPMISDMTRDYWLEIGREAGLSTDFEVCYNSEDSVSEVKTNTYKASSLMSGLPYFTFGKFSAGGFDPGWE